MTTSNVLPLMKILLIGGPADGKIVQIPENDIIKLSWCIRVPDPKNWDYILLYKVRIVNDKILKSKSFDAIIFDYCDE